MIILVFFLLCGVIGIAVSAAFEDTILFGIFFILTFISLLGIMLKIEPKNSLPRTGEINVIEMSHGFAEKY